MVLPAAEDHTRLIKIRQQKSGISAVMVGSEFGVNGMKAWMLPCVKSSECNGVTL